MEKLYRGKNPKICVEKFSISNTGTAKEHKMYRIGLILLHVILQAQLKSDRQDTLKVLNILLTLDYCFTVWYVILILQNATLEEQ